MNIVFVSNYYNHHQHPLSQELFKLCHGEFTFVATSEMRADRKALGYVQDSAPDYVLRAHTSEETKKLCLKRILDADVVLAGSAPEEYFNARRKAGKLILRYAERPLKTKTPFWRAVPRYLRWHIRNPRQKPIYLLAASAYAPYDFSRYGVFRDRAFRWGYFPQAKHYDDVDQLLEKKNAQKILWAGRHLDWKRPDDAVFVAQELKKKSIPFRMEIIGTGPMTDSLKRQIEEAGLCDCVTLLGSMPPENVRAHMEEAGIYLFTSNRQEGWGAVLNEALNSGCAVVASRAIGSAPFLLSDRENGILYPSNDRKALCRAVEELLTDLTLQKRLGQRGYRTVTEEWNPQNAANRLFRLCETLLSGQDPRSLFAAGPCSPAPVLKDETP